MFRKPASVIMFSLLVLGMLAFAKIRPAMSSPVTVTVPDDYPTIQGAINAVNNGDTVYVRSGTYPDDVVVNKSISLVGQDPVTTSIAPTIDNGGPRLILADVSNVSISGFNVFSFFYPALEISSCSDVQIENCTFSSNSETHGSLAGSSVDSSENLTFRFCQFASGDHGPSIVLTNLYNSTFNSCDLVGHGENGAGGALTLVNSFRNSFYGNTIKSDIGGATSSGGCAVTLSNSYNNTFCQNAMFVVPFPPDGSPSSPNIIVLQSSSFNVFYHNNMHTISLPSVSGSNTWDNGYPEGGNWWSNYNGTDVYSGPSQNITGSDGIGDEPVFIAPGNLDNYPVMNPFLEFQYIFNIAVTKIIPYKTVVGRGTPMLVNVSIENQGRASASTNLTLETAYTYVPTTRSFTLLASATQGWNNSIPGPTITAFLGDNVSLELESAEGLRHKFYVDYNGNAFPDADEPQSGTFINSSVQLEFPADTVGNFTYYCAYYQGTMFGQFLVTQPQVFTCISSQNVSLVSQEKVNATFSFATAQFPLGNYSLRAYATRAFGETDTSDNNFTGGWVVVSIAGDLTGGTPNPWDFVPDGKVDGKDIAIVALCFGSAPGCQPPWIWNSNCDVNNDGKIDGKDIALVALHFGEAVFP